MTFTFCTSGAILRKAGANVNSSIALSTDALTEFCDYAEAQVNTLTHKDWAAASAAILPNFKAILADVISDIAAIKLVNYDMSGYTSRLEAQTILDVLRDNVSRNIDALNVDNNKKAMGV